jgi:hypothetical protein
MPSASIMESLGLCSGSCTKAGSTSPMAGDLDLKNDLIFYKSLWKKQE